MRLIQVDGNLAADAEVKVSSKGNKFLQFRMASNEYGEDGPVWVNVISFNEFDVNRAQWMLKGKHVVVSGTFKPTAYISKYSPEPVAGMDIKADRVEWLNSGKPENSQETQNGTVQQTKQDFTNTQYQQQPQQPQYQPQPQQYQVQQSVAQPQYQQPQQQQYQPQYQPQQPQYQPQQNITPMVDSSDDLPF